MSAPEPQVPQCANCGSRKGPWRPTGERYPSGAQVLVCSQDCTSAEPLPVREIHGRTEQALMDRWLDQHGDPADWPQDVRLAYANTVANMRALGTS